MNMSMLVYCSCMCVLSVQMCAHLMESLLENWHRILYIIQCCKINIISSIWPVFFFLVDDCLQFECQKCVHMKKRNTIYTSKTALSPLATYFIAISLVPLHLLHILIPWKMVFVSWFFFFFPVRTLCICYFRSVSEDAKTNNNRKRKKTASVHEFYVQPSCI